MACATKLRVRPARGLSVGQAVSREVGPHRRAAKSREVYARWGCLLRRDACILPLASTWCPARASSFVSTVAESRRWYACQRQVHAQGDRHKQRQKRQLPMMVTRSHTSSVSTSTGREIFVVPRYVLSLQSQHGAYQPSKHGDGAFTARSV